MTNDPEKIGLPLETELARFTPAKLPPALRQRITNEIAQPPLSFADRLFATVAILGTIAAALILTITLSQLATPEPTKIPQQDIALHQKLTAEYQKLLAAK